MKGGERREDPRRKVRRVESIFSIKRIGIGRRTEEVLNGRAARSKEDGGEMERVDKCRIGARLMGERKILRLDKA